MSIFSSWLHHYMSVGYAIAFLGYLGTELQNYSALTFVCVHCSYCSNCRKYFVMVPVNVIFDIVGMAVQSTYSTRDALTIFLIVMSSLGLPVKVFSSFQSVRILKLFAGSWHGLGVLPAATLCRKRWCAGFLCICALMLAGYAGGAAPGAPGGYAGSGVLAPSVSYSKGGYGNI